MKPRKKKTGVGLPLPAESLARAAWHEALVRIAGGLAHDTNNCLAGIVSLSEHGIDLASQRQSFKEELATINQAAHKAGDILKNFLHLNPAKAQEPTYYDLNALTSEAVDLLRRVLKRKVEVELQLGPGPLPVFLEGLELKKAIICLAFNLADCIPGTAKIIFQTFVPAEPEPARVYQGIWPKGPTVCLGLSTTAPECATVQWEELFDPAMTGDAQTDLFRLRFCLNNQAMERANGAFSIQSGPSGTQFHLFLPKASLD